MSVTTVTPVPAAFHMRVEGVSLSFGERRVLTDVTSLLLVDELEAAVPRYPGAVVVASHDRWLRRTWTGNVLQLV